MRIFFFLYSGCNWSVCFMLMADMKHSAVILLSPHC